MITVALLAIFPCAMVFAACSDLVSMTISNRVPIALVVGFLVLSAWIGTPLAAVGANCLVAFACLVVTFGFFAAGWMGGGDAKLIAATALWFGPTQDLASYLVMSSAYGGALTFGLLALRGHMVAATGLPMVDRLLSKETGVPYGIALGAAGLTVFDGGHWLDFGISALRSSYTP